MKTLLRELSETVILALLIFLALQFTVQNFRVEGSSMDPTLDEDQYLVVNKLVYMHLGDRLRSFIPFMDGDNDSDIFPFHPPKAGEVIVFKFPQDPSRDFVKRVIGVPGDVVRINRGKVFVNELLQDEPYITFPSQGSMSPVAVPDNAFFVMGDNRRASNDSRDWGPVPAENIIGKAWITYWPFDSLATIGGTNNP